MQFNQQCIALSGNQAQKMWLAVHSIFMNSVIKQGGQMLDELIERGFKLTYKETALELHNKLRQSLKGKKYSQIKQIVSHVI